MEDLNNKEIETLLDKWFSTKQEISKLESKCEKYKKCAEIILNNKNTNHISTDFHKLTRKEISRSSISKKDVPKDIWNKYSKTQSFPVYYLSEK